MIIDRKATNKTNKFIVLIFVSRENYQFKTLEIDNWHQMTYKQLEEIVAKTVDIKTSLLKMYINDKRVTKKLPDKAPKSIVVSDYSDKLKVDKRNGCLNKTLISGYLDAKINFEDVATDGEILLVNERNVLENMDENKVDEYFNKIIESLFN